MLTKILLLVAFIVAVTLSPYHLPGLFPYMDKVGHLAAYFTLTLLLSRVLTIRKAVFIAVLVGTGMEFVQTLTPTRTFEVLDIVANISGAVLCWGIVSLFKFGFLLQKERT